MSEYREFAASVNDYGQLVVDRKMIAREIRVFKGKKIVIKFSEPTRGSSRNRRLHAVLGEVADALGWETDEFKEFIITKLRPADECPITGFQRRQRTHKMTDSEIDQLVTEIQAWTVQEMPGFVFRDYQAA